MQQHIKPYLAFLMLFTALSLVAQENSIYERYYLSPFVINPAMAGSSGYSSLNLSYRQQWLDVPHAPSTQILSADYRLGTFAFYNPRMMVNKTSVKNKERMALGGILFNDMNGPERLNGMMLAYAYHLPMNSFALSFGLSGNFIQHVLDESMFKPYDEGDPDIGFGKERKFTGNSDAGIYVYSKDYFAGISANQLVPVKDKIGNTGNTIRDYYLFGGYRLSGKSHFELEPSVCAKYLNHEEFRYDAHLKIYYRYFNWLAISYRSYGAAIVQVGFKAGKIHLAYGYETSTEVLRTYYNGVHEFSLGYNLGLRNVDGIRKLAD